MAKIIVAFSEEAQVEKIAGALEESGIAVYRRCRTGNEALRALSVCQDGVVVSGTKFVDRTADELAEDMGSRALMLAVGKPERLAMCENPGVFKLTAPFGRGELASAVRMLMQLQTMRAPHRSTEEEQLVLQAKRLLMELNGLSEPQAHRAIQRISMNLGLRMSDSARRIINGEDVFGGALWSLTQ